jgi:hypothetical protein
MLRRNFLVLVMSAFLFTGCFDVIETYQLKEDGSGVYTMEFDASRSMDIFGSLITASLAEQGISNDAEPNNRLPVDSIYLFKDFIDTVKDLSVQEKNVLRNGYAKMHFDGSKKQGYVRIGYPFANNAELAIIQEAMDKKQFIGEKDGSMNNFLKEGNAGKLFGSSALSRYSFLLSDNCIERKFIGKDSSWIVLEATANDDEAMGALFSSVSKISSKTILELPRPVKNYQSSGTIILSDDKKKITIVHLKTDATVLKPLEFTYRVEY